MISLPDGLFEQLDALAAKMRIDRRQLYVLALERYLNEHHESRVTRAINKYIDHHGQPADAGLITRAVTDLRRVEW